MLHLHKWVIIGCLSASCACANPTHSTAYPTPNAFEQYLGVSSVEVKEKLGSVWAHFFEGDADTQRIYFEVPGNMAYIADIGNNDVRSEGMSYGMMIAVMLNKQEAFNRMWKC